MTITGKPSISDVRSNDARSLGIAVSNIRQRIEAIEGSLGAVESTVTQSSSTGSTQFNVLRQQIAALQAELATLEIAAVLPEDQTNQLATRVFMPRPPLVPAVVPPEDRTNQLATQVFARRSPSLPDLALAGDNATRVLITQIFGA